MLIFFLFCVFLGNLRLRHIGNLSKTLQHKYLSAAEGWKVAKLTLDVLQYLCNEDHFYAQVLLEQVRFKVYAPALPRKRKAPQ